MSLACDTSLNLIVQSMDPLHYKKMYSIKHSKIIQTVHYSFASPYHIILRPLKRPCISSSFL